MSFLTDPVLRAPLIGSMLMCLSSALVGVFVLLRRRSLIGETLSHAAYPGVVVSVLVAAALFPNEKGVALGALFGAFVAIVLAQLFLSQVTAKLRLKDDAALTLTLTGFFGIGVLAASHVQSTHAALFRTVQNFLFGQAATMRDGHIALYGGLTLLVIGAMVAFYRPFSLLYFDRSYARSVGVRAPLFDGLFSILLALSIVIGIRSVGVVLMSAMLIAPAVAARTFTRGLRSLLIVSASLGVACGLGGNLLSIYLPRWLDQPQLVLATGPMIVVVGSLLVLASLLLSPKRGLVARKVKVARFRQRCLEENVLKALPQTQMMLRARLGASRLRLLLALYHLRRKGWLRRDLLALTSNGEKAALRLVRLHRLWEVYLVHMGQDAKVVHHSAEEMEHILTPEVEAQLVTLLDDPTHDPHLQPIPEAVL
ncbi:MAG: Manganese transport system membrane protein MntB [Chlamydiae bacterium]|nr:Manganese transport system membrane protein MntB [Chlamydiota bacterium]